MPGIIRIRMLMVLIAGLTASCGPSPSSVQIPRRGPPVVALPPAGSRIAPLPPMPSVSEWKPSAPARDWKHIVIHHTAASSGSVEAIHEQHLKRGWDGIGYHFVIGNGNGMPDGSVEATFRWKTQMHGAHAGSEEYNQRGIGICLIGNFEESRPSAAQLSAIKRLVAALKRDYRIPADRIIGHKDVKATACPGKNFPFAEVAQSELLPSFVQSDLSPSQRPGELPSSLEVDFHVATAEGSLLP